VRLWIGHAKGPQPPIVYIQPGVGDRDQAAKSAGERFSDQFGDRQAGAAARQPMRHRPSIEPHNQPDLGSQVGDLPRQLVLRPARLG
jgi:hypothetical protein